MQVNVKASDKDLQFGGDKCKSMIVSKRKPYSYQTTALSVDSCTIEHEDNGHMKETFTGKEK